MLHEWLEDEVRGEEWAITLKWSKWEAVGEGGGCPEKWSKSIDFPLCHSLTSFVSGLVNTARIPVVPFSG